MHCLINCFSCWHRTGKCLLGCHVATVGLNTLAGYTTDFSEKKNFFGNTYYNVCNYVGEGFSNFEHRILWDKLLHSSKFAPFYFIFSSLTNLKFITFRGKQASFNLFTLTYQMSTKQNCYKEAWNLSLPN